MATNGNVIHANFSPRQRRMIRFLRIGGRTQVAPLDLVCTGPDCKARLIKRGALCWVFQTQDGAVTRRCLDCCIEGL